MHAISNQSITASSSAAEAFQAALGVAQQTKNIDLLAVHNEGRRLVAIEKSKMSNPKIYVVEVEDQGPQPTLRLAVGTDPRVRKALMDGKFNEKSANRFVEAVRAALSGAAPAPATPVDNHYMQKKARVAWTDPTQEPDIDLGFSWLGVAGYMR